MRKFSFVLLMVLAAMFLQGAVLKFAFPTMTIPNLFLVLVVFIGFFEPSTLGALLAFMVGLLFDLFSRGLLGPHASAYVVVFGIVAALSQRIFVDSRLAVFLTVLLASLIGNVVYLIVLSEFVQVESLVTMLLRGALWEAFLTALLAPFLFVLLRRGWLKLVRTSLLES